MPDFENIVNKSLFSKSTYSKTVSDSNGAYRIQITPLNLNRGDLGIIGVINERISINMDPEWDVLNLASIVSNFPKLESLFNMAVAPMAAAGTSLTNAGLITEKFFVKGSYLQIEPSFKVVNWNDDGQPIKAALILLNLCTPKRTSDKYETSPQQIGAALKKQSQELAKQDNFIGKAASVALEGAEKVAAIIETTVNKLDDPLKNSYLQGANAILTGKFMLTQAPPGVFVQIGNYFEHPEMILENVSVEFSEEMTKTGPLFAEFKCTLSSKSMPVLAGKDKFGLGLKRSGAKITFEGETNIDTTGV